MVSVDLNPASAHCLADFPSSNLNSHDPFRLMELAVAVNMAISVAARTVFFIWMKYSNFDLPQQGFVDPWGLPP